MLLNVLTINIVMICLFSFSFDSYVHGAVMQKAATGRIVEHLLNSEATKTIAGEKEKNMAKTLVFAS